MNVTAVAVTVMLAIGAAYLLFLAYTWNQMQRDRITAMARVDDMLDRLPVPKGNDDNVAPATD